MSTIVTNCPRCDANQMTFDVIADGCVGERHGWVSLHEASVMCRRCKRVSILKLELNDITFKRNFFEAGSLTKLKGDLEPTMRKVGFLDVSDLAGVAQPPAHLPPEIEAAFVEGAKCMSIRCYNASAAMFRLCLDLTTKPLLPDPADSRVQQPTKFQRFNLGARIDWLLDQSRLPLALRELAICVRRDGNDGVHDGNLSETDAEDLLDFSIALLERLFTEPARLREAEIRRIARRAAP